MNSPLDELLRGDGADKATSLEYIKNKMIRYGGFKDGGVGGGRMSGREDEWKGG